MFQNKDTKDLKDLRKIGQGSFGVVYSGRWKGSGEGGRDLLVAMKELELSATDETPMAGELMRDLLKDFKKEVDICVGLNHPHLVKFYGYSTEDPEETGKSKGPRSRIIRPRIILELMEGGALDHLLYTRQWKPSITQVLKMSTDAVEAMIYLHTAGTDGKPIIHRDLKSPNLLLVRFPSTEEEEGTFVPKVKITDFGLAREKDARDKDAVGDFRESIADGNAAMRQTQIMTGCGTLYWMAPEVLKGDVYNESVDVYAFAMCLLEMISGKVPWRTIPAQEVPYKVAMEAARPDLPLELLNPSRGTRRYVLKKLIQDCWAQDPVSRPRFDGTDGIMGTLQECQEWEDG
jgi:serine/threonine protein kinase